MRIKYTLLLLLLLAAQHISYAQSPPPDFRKELAAANTDSQKLGIYKNISEYYKNSNNDSLKAYVEQGLQFFSDHGYDRGKAVLLIMRSAIYSEEGLPIAAMKNADEALSIFERLKDETNIAKAHNSIGVLDAYSGNYVPAFKHFLTALKHFEHISDTAEIINTYIKLGAVNDYNGNFDKALVYYNKALKMSLSTVESGNTIYLYNNIGTSYARKGEFDLALRYFEKAQSLSNKPQYAMARVSPLTNIGKIYIEKKNNRKALEYFYEALSSAKTLKMQEEYGRILFEIGLIETVADPSNTTSLQAALKVAKELKNKSMQADILNGMADVAHEHGNYKDEVEFMKQERVIHDSIFNIDKAREIANLQSEYELDKTTTQLTALKLSERQNLQKKNAIIAIAIVLTLTLITLMIFYSRSKRLNKILSVREQDLNKANSVKDRLFSIIGHDLKGPIGNIPALLSIYKSEDSTEEEKGYILKSLEENSVASLETLEKLLSWGKQQIKGNIFNPSVFGVEEIINNKLRLVGVAAANKNITIVNNIPPATRIFADENHFKFIMRNLLSNAVKYTRSGGLVEISAEKHPDENYVTFSVKDNGVGIDKEMQEHIFEPYNESTVGTSNELGTSLGLMLCKEFIIQNGGNIWVKSEKDQGTTFSFTVMAINPEDN